MPHQKIDIGLLSLSQVLAKILKQFITYVDIACVTNFKNTSLPALDTGMLLETFSLFHNLPVRKLKLFNGQRPTQVGMPR